MPAILNAQVCLHIQSQIEYCMAFGIVKWGFFFTDCYLVYEAVVSLHVLLDSLLQDIVYLAEAGTTNRVKCLYHMNAKPGRITAKDLVHTLAIRTTDGSLRILVSLHRP